MKHRKAYVASAVAACGWAAAIPGASAQQYAELGPRQFPELSRLSIEELTQIPVTSVLMRPEALSKTPDSVFVIEGGDISAIGATSLPEALRIAPNLQVARDSAQTYGVTARGMNSFETANKLLVLVDGRSIYTPLHSGVFWDEEPVFLDDIDRIEVISGPGGATWGANAINGVVNVLTRDAFQTEGFLARASGGNLEKFAAARFGRRVGENAAFRVYGQAFDRENSVTLSGADAGDDFDGASGGFRFDMDSGASRWTLQGDLFEHGVGSAGDLSGGNLLARWTLSGDDGGSLQVQAWADRSERNEPALETHTDVADVSIQQTLPQIGTHRIVWGGGYRHIDDSFVAPGLFTLDPARDSSSLWTTFVQDTLTLSDRLSVTAGLKLEYSDYSGAEYLPSVRLAYAVSESALFWAAVSRGVRTPVRLDRDLVSPGLFAGGPNFDSETLVAYEAGYRTSWGSQASFSGTVFVHDYNGLRTTSSGPGGGLPLEFLNGMSGTTSGVELWGDYQMAEWWRVSAGLTTLSKDFDLDPGLIDVSDPPAYGLDPDYQVILRSQMELSPTVNLNTMLRVVDDLPDPEIPGYTQLDAKLAWRVTPNVELYVTGANLLDEAHPETDANNSVLQNRRSVQAGAAWVF